MEHANACPVVTPFLHNPLRTYYWDVQTNEKQINITVLSDSLRGSELQANAACDALGYNKNALTFISSEERPD